ncbi:MAG: hypothetical protein NTV68_11105 [Methanomicrobiales archaeon]|nr:hypothetical protein [Methanomicrobiales archaeon]
MTGKTTEFDRMALVTVRPQGDGWKYKLFGTTDGADRRREILHSLTVSGNGPGVDQVVYGVNHGGT